MPLLQYMLNVVGEFVQSVPQPPQNGMFDEETRGAVLALQRYVSLPETGVVDEETWNAILAQYTSIDATVFRNSELFPENTNPDAVEVFASRTGAKSKPQTHYQSSTRFVQFPGMTLRVGMRDSEV